MKIGIIGASGKAGNAILKEALDRGHEVVAIVRNASSMTDDVAIIEKNALDLTNQDLLNLDTVVNAFGATPGLEHLHVKVGNVLIEALQNTSTRLFVVGGAGSLFVNEEKTTRVVDTPNFPEEFKATALNQGENLAILQQSEGISWTFLSPSALFTLGKRTGHFQLGKDHLLVNSTGNSYVSYEDYAIAVLDEIENPHHINQRFTIASEEA
ncbi:NAD(P)-dependent oxidoreductase [Marininema halotolerans]|uniref:NAD(P)-binding domain-containing protein n=1 Tax=Marininema halotolerans TaxID=1155944 RepID=A0A1I6PRA4_9BACL|nr:NAD(P)-dependent oxidoreductase [Marininema halotolerans]SFS42716.1 hypothetical protein SAMN05444972_10281 [Marininema halotolerans]